MKELNLIIAENITSLRKNAKITQLELANSLNYSDKAVSKWERGESLPDIAVIKQIADFFGVTVDYLLTEEHREFKEQKLKVSARQKRNRLSITLISTVLVWFIATFAFFNIHIFGVQNFKHWLVFVYAVPVSTIVILIFNSIWGKPRFNFFIISVLVWSFLLSVFLTLLNFGINWWLLFALGIPGQIIIILWSGIKKA